MNFGILNVSYNCCFDQSSRNRLDNNTPIDSFSVWIKLKCAQINRIFIKISEFNTLQEADIWTFFVFYCYIFAPSEFVYWKYLNLTLIFQQFWNCSKRLSTIDIINTLLKIWCGKYFIVKNNVLLEKNFLCCHGENDVDFYLFYFRQTTHLSHLDYMNWERKLHSNWTV